MWNNAATIGQNFFFVHPGDMHYYDCRALIETGSFTSNMVRFGYDITWFCWFSFQHRSKNTRTFESLFNHHNKNTLILHHNTIIWSRNTPSERENEWFSIVTYIAYQRWIIWEPTVFENPFCSNWHMHKIAFVTFNQAIKLIWSTTAPCHFYWYSCWLVGLILLTNLHEVNPFWASNRLLSHTRRGNLLNRLTCISNTCDNLSWYQNGESFVSSSIYIRASITTIHKQYMCSISMQSFWVMLLTMGERDGFPGNIHTNNTETPSTYGFNENSMLKALIYTKHNGRKAIERWLQQCDISMKRAKRQLQTWYAVCTLWLVL